MSLLIPSEFSEQCTLVQWLRLMKVHFYAIPNGFCANAKEGSRMKKSGLQVGVPDICIPIMRNGYGALYIELKRKCGSYAGVNQQAWLDYLNSAGYRALICKGSDHAIREIENYLEEKK